MCFFSEKFYIEMERTLEQFGDRIVVISGVIGDKINIVADKVKNLSVNAVNHIATLSPKITIDKAVQTERLTKINYQYINTKTALQDTTKTALHDTTKTSLQTVDNVEPNKKQNEIKIKITEEDESTDKSHDKSLDKSHDKSLDKSLDKSSSTNHWPKTNQFDWFLDESWDIVNDS